MQPSKLGSWSVKAVILFLGCVLTFDFIFYGYDLFILQKQTKRIDSVFNKFLLVPSGLVFDRYVLYFTGLDVTLNFSDKQIHFKENSRITGNYLENRLARTLHLAVASKKDFDANIDYSICRMHLPQMKTLSLPQSNPTSVSFNLVNLYTNEINRSEYNCAN